jgi:DNA-binding MarR family transcriptional regulator
VDELTPAEQGLWEAVGRLVHRLPRRLDEDMTRATGLSMTEYAVLQQLSAAPARSLRMSDLARATALSPSRMSRVVDALGKAGLVRRDPHPEDARSAVAVLTHEGEQRRRGAEGAQTAVARHRVLGHLPAEHVAAATRIVQDLLSGLNDGPNPLTQSGHSDVP